MSVPTLQENDVGVALVLTVVDETGAALNLSSATSIQIFITKPDDTLLTETAAFKTDGKDGKIEYLTQAGDVDMLGQYHIQARYVEDTFLRHTQRGTFVVQRNLAGVS